MITDWDDAYANGAYIAGADEFPPRWAEAAQSFRKELFAEARAEIDLAYAKGKRNRFDMFLPEGKPAGLVVFVHGGYWKAFDKSTWSGLARGPVERGWAVAVPSYTLAPDARIGWITQEIAALLKVAGARVAGPILLAGHSAGGHLVSRMVCSDVRMEDRLRARIKHVLSISGVHDLRPLVKTEMNTILRLDMVHATAESPVLLRPVANTRLTTWVGGEERPEFIRQSELLANVWTGLGASTRSVIDPGLHHFDVIDSLSRADGALTEALVAN